ncbi:zinc finger protein 90-like [Maniola jurtina]|uniref:zinc finger protein 90-like n=1 Tax=Maniola jurtina TaxID=191418 RepID=UPI001E6890EF|nr:zinc finger protein 90-like [Maniola jurtina]
MEQEKTFLSNSAAASSVNFSMQKPVVKKGEEIANYVCYLCRKTFYNANALQNHKNMQHDSNGSSNDDYQPTSNRFEEILDVLCDFQFIPLKKPNEDIIKVERDGITKRTYGEGTSYLIVKYESCETAGAKKSRLSNMIKKIQLKPERKLVDLRGPFTCTLPSNVYLGAQCRQIFFNCCEYSLHYREEHTKRRKAVLRCQVCEKRLDRNPIYPTNALTSQMESTNVVSFTCHVCGVAFFDSTQYDEHKRIVHAKIKPHQCSICSKRFTQIGGLQQHMRMHNGIRPFICKFCGKAFTQKAGLDQHLRTHTKVKPFKCIICCKCFSQSVHLRQHMRTHTNIQPFGCPVCQKRFKQSSHLNFHMRSHVDEMSALLMEQYGQTSSMDFLNLSNVQPVQDGETLYYAAQLTSGPEATTSTPYIHQGRQAPLIPNNLL